MDKLDKYKLIMLDSNFSKESLFSEVDKAFMELEVARLCESSSFKFEQSLGTPKGVSQFP